MDLTCSGVTNVIAGGGRHSKRQGEDGRGRHLDVKLHHDARSLTRHERMSTSAELHIPSISAPRMTKRRRHRCQCPSYRYLTLTERKRLKMRAHHRTDVWFSFHSLRFSQQPNRTHANVLKSELDWIRSARCAVRATNAIASTYTVWRNKTKKLLFR